MCSWLHGGCCENTEAYPSLQASCGLGSWNNPLSVYAMVLLTHPSVDRYGLFPLFGFMNNVAVWLGWWPQSAVSHLAQFSCQQAAACFHYEGRLAPH